MALGLHSSLSLPLDKELLEDSDIAFCHSIPSPVQVFAEWMNNLWKIIKDSPPLLLLSKAVSGKLEQ